MMNLTKIGIVIGHEYQVRVRKKSFILTTVLTPLLMGLLICVPTLIMLMGSDEDQRVMVADQSGIVYPYLESGEHVIYEAARDGITVDELRDAFDTLGCYAVVGISTMDEAGNLSVVSYSKEPLNVEIKGAVNRAVNRAVEDYKLAQYNITDLDRILSDVKSDIRLNSMTLGEDGEAKENTVEIYMALAYIMSFLIYIFVFMFGTMVMRSVIDEKSSRVVEIIVSSVKSVELMVGKIIGVALVALTQFFIWVVLTLMIAAGLNAAVGPKLMQSAGTSTELVQMAGTDAASAVAEVAEAAQNGENSGVIKVISEVRNLDWGYILICFLIYFLLGYLLYAAMFAAIGAAVDNEADTSQLQLPVTIPLIVGLFIMLHTFEHPSSALSFWASMIPFTSPMVMLARIPFGVVPLWQLLLSIVLLLATFLVMAWLSAKIYKVGILTYGKKSSFKDLVKWLKQRD